MGAGRPVHPSPNIDSHRVVGQSLYPSRSRVVEMIGASNAVVKYDATSTPKMVQEIKSETRPNEAGVRRIMHEHAGDHREDRHDVDKDEDGEPSRAKPAHAGDVDGQKAGCSSASPFDHLPVVASRSDSWHVDVDASKDMHRREEEEQKSRQPTMEYVEPLISYREQISFLEAEKERVDQQKPVTYESKLFLPASPITKGNSENIVLAQ